MIFAVREAPVDPGEAIAAVAHPGAGAVDVFCGVVRNTNDGRAVSKLEYQAYEAMAVREMERIAAEIAVEIPGTRLAAIHRVGVLGVGDVAVVCAASAPHRSEAFTACRLLIDRLKERVPVWKREYDEHGDAYWVGWKDARCIGHDHSP